MRTHNAETGDSDNTPSVEKQDARQAERRGVSKILSHSMWLAILALLIVLIIAYLM